MNQAQVSLVYVVSDSVGETADLVVRAAVSQFEKRPEVRRFPYVDDQQTIEELVQSATENQALIVFTLVLPELRDYLVQLAQQAVVPFVDIMGPIMDALESTFQQRPKHLAGLVRQLDEDYYRRVEAIEFAVKYDDGRDPRGILRSDVVLIGVSRTSKTPLSMYLAHKRIKVANVPLVPEVEPPEELFSLPPSRCMGLVIQPEQLNIIRTERLKSLGLEFGAQYATLQRIQEELSYARSIMERIGCPIIDVTHKAVEETANLILDLLHRTG